MIYTLSDTGYHHSALSEENQDAVSFATNRKYTVISLADGVSSCKEAKKGAEIACRAVTDLLLMKGDYFLEFEKDQISRGVMAHVLHEIDRQARKESKCTDEYSSTVESALYDKKHHKLLFFHLGDGVIIASGKNGCRVIANPAHSTAGCCVTTTQNAVSATKVGIIDTASFDSVVICSDGAWREMYSGNRLKTEVASFLVERNFDKLKHFLRSQHCFDDYSFISMDLIA